MPYIMQSDRQIRFGTAWHRGLEVLSKLEGTIVPSQGDLPPVELTGDNLLQYAMEVACEVYKTVPDWADPAEWAVEREIVACALAAYHWL